MSAHVPVTTDDAGLEPGGGNTAAAEADRLPHLTDEQIHTWTLAQKDEWWLKNVYKGDMPQLTVRSALTGMLLGGVLSLTNLYVGAKTGWTLGVGITSVILAFAAFKLLARMGLSEFTVLENNAMQSIATAAGYMTGPLVTSVGAYIMVTDKLISPLPLMAWLATLSTLGVLFAFPLKKRFINDEQMPFPEGRAAGVVMHALHTGDAKEGLFKAKLLVATAGLSSLVTLLKSEAITTKLKLTFLHLPEHLDGWFHKLVTPAILGTPLKNIGVRAPTDLVMFAAGGLMGIRTGVSLLLGAAVNYFWLVPWMIQRGDITGKLRDGEMVYGIKDITFWSLWVGVAMMTTSSLLSFFSKPQVILSAFKLLGRKKGEGARDVLEDIELPAKVSAFGIPILGALAVAIGAYTFDIKPWLGVLAVPFVFILTLIAVTSTGLTSITPVGAMGKLTQLTYAGLAPGNVTTNLMTAGITAEVSSNAANLLMDIKPGYMLGAKPRQQAVGHVLGILVGALVCVPVYYALFLHKGPQNLITDDYPFPGVLQWKAVAEVLTQGLSNLKPSAQLGALIGAVLGILLEVVKLATKNRFPITAVGVGLAFVLSFGDSLVMGLGAVAVWAAEHAFKKEGFWKKVAVENAEPTCAGLIAGGALMGIAVTLLEVFVLG